MNVSIDEFKQEPPTEFFLAYQKKLIGLYKIEEKIVRPIVYLYEVENG